MESSSRGRRLILCASTGFAREGNLFQPLHFIADFFRIEKNDRSDNATIESDVQPSLKQQHQAVSKEYASA